MNGEELCQANDATTCAKIRRSYSQSFVYCRVFVLLIIDYSTKKGVLVYSRKCASEIVFRSNPVHKAVRVNVLADIALLV